MAPVFNKNEKHEEEQPMTLKEIREMQRELDTQLKFADALHKELGEIMKRGFDGHVLEADIPRAAEIDDLLVEKNAWITKAKAQIGAFYKPATSVG